MVNTVVAAADLCVGDTISRNGVFWKIRKIRRTTLRGDKRVNLRVDWARIGPEPTAKENVSIQMYTFTNAVRVSVPACFPCYDSDCECIFAGVM